MATRHELPGQYAKKQAAVRLARAIDLALSLALALGLVCGVAGAFTFKGYGLYASLALVTVLPLLFIVRRGVFRYVDRMAKERIRYLRGAQAEALVNWLLEDLDEPWHVFNGIKLTRDSDVDHVVVGPRGLFCISTKSHRGLFCGTPQGLLYNNAPSDLAQQAMRQAMELKDRLTAAMGTDVPWVQPVLAVPLGFVTGDACGGRVWVVHQDDLLRRINPDAGKPKLDDGQITRTAKVLEMIQQSAADIYRRPPPPPSVQRHTIAAAPAERLRASSRQSAS